jgi:hypothetical protein
MLTVPTYLPNLPHSLMQLAVHDTRHQ